MRGEFTQRKKFVVTLVFRNDDEPVLFRSDSTGDKSLIMRKRSKTDWTRLESMKDADLDFRDIPELGDDFFKRAELRMPPKQAITIRVDADVLAWFKAQGKGYQTRINMLMRAFMESQRH